MGVVDAEGHLAGTARLVRSGSLGLPMFHHCTLFPNETVLDEVGNVVVEVSRVSISRHYARRKDDGPFGGTRVPDANDGDLVRPPRERRRRSRSCGGWWTRQPRPSWIVQAAGRT